MQKLRITTSGQAGVQPKQADSLPRAKSASGRYVLRHGKLVPKWSVNEHNDKRSDLPSPYVVPDVPEHLNHATGEHVSTRRRHREILREHNLIEIGNEKMPAKEYKPTRGEVAREIKETIEQLRAGYVNPDEGVMPADYVEEASPDLDAIDVDVNSVSNGEYIRQENKPE